MMDNEEQPQANEKPKNKLPVMWIGIVIVIVLIIAALALTTFGPAKNLTANKTKTTTNITTTNIIKSNTSISNTSTVKTTLTTTLVNNSTNFPVLINASEFNSVLGGSWKTATSKLETIPSLNNVSFYYENVTSSNNNLISLGILKYTNATVPKNIINLESASTNKTDMANGTIGSSIYVYIKKSNSPGSSTSTIYANYSGYLIVILTGASSNSIFTQKQGVALMSAELAKFS